MPVPTTVGTLKSPLHAGFFLWDARQSPPPPPPCPPSVSVLCVRPLCPTLYIALKLGACAPMGDAADECTRGLQANATLFGVPHVRKSLGISREHAGIDDIEAPQQAGRLRIDGEPGPKARYSRLAEQRPWGDYLTSGTKQASVSCKSLSRAKFITKSKAIGSMSRSRSSTTTHLTSPTIIGRT